MNASQISKETESLTMTSKELKPKIKIKPKLNTKFFSMAKCTATFTDKPNFENTQYRKTISYLRPPLIVDLMKQSNLVEKKTMRFDKNYLINLIKMEKKKDKSMLPTIDAFQTFSPRSNAKFRTISIDLSDIKKNDTFQLQKTFNFSNINKNKEKINELYKKVYSGNKSNLKIVYVNQFINNNKNVIEEKESTNLNIKPKMINTINHNLIISQKRFMKYHGFNKRIQYNYKMQSYNKKKDKYPNLDSVQILQFFLKKKLKILINEVSKAKDECDMEKNNLISAYESFNEKAQKHIDEAFRNEEKL